MFDNERYSQKNISKKYLQDKDGDGVVTAEEFVEHAHSQEACANGKHIYIYIYIYILIVQQWVHKNKKKVPHQQTYHTKTRGSMGRALRTLLVFEALSY